VHRLSADHVVVVEDQQRVVRVGQAGQVVDQGRHQRLERGRHRRADQRAHPHGDPRTGPIERGHRVPPEPGRVVVTGVQRQPGDRPVTAASPLGHQDRLAVPRPGGRPGPDPAPTPRRGDPPSAGGAPGPAAHREHAAWWRAANPARRRRRWRRPPRAKAAQTSTQCGPPPQRRHHTTRHLPALGKWAFFAQPHAIRYDRARRSRSYRPSEAVPEDRRAAPRDGGAVRLPAAVLPRLRRGRHG
jgi:hypothetical protein